MIPERHGSVKYSVKMCIPLPSTAKNFWCAFLLYKLCHKIICNLTSHKHWRHYLFHKEFVLYTKHDTLKYLSKFTSRHASWIGYLQQFTFVIKHTSGASNRVAKGLSHRQSLLAVLHSSVPGLPPLLIYMPPIFSSTISFRKYCPVHH